MITKQKFKAYLEVQKGGATNMIDIEAVKVLSGYILDKEDCFDIMKNYRHYKEEFNLSLDGVTASKKRFKTIIMEE